MQHLRLTHPALDLWIDVRLREFDGRWLAVAELADTPEVGTGETPEEALRGALSPFGPRLCDELVASAEAGQGVNHVPESTHPLIMPVAYEAAMCRLLADGALEPASLHGPGDGPPPLTRYHQNRR